MSRLPDDEPACRPAPDDQPALKQVIEPHTRDLGGFHVRRALPAATCRSVGPFVFCDHMGPARFDPGQGLDVRPHPHIHLATVTYLFEGEIVHRDSLGSEQPIRPGAINWMTAGRGIVHSERTGSALRRSGSRAHGLQLWVGLPSQHEDTDPTFRHHPADTLPEVEPAPGARAVVLAGAAYGQRSPVELLSPLLFVDVQLEAGASLSLPGPEEQAQRALYIIGGTVSLRGALHQAGRMLVLSPGAEVEIEAKGPARLAILAGAPLDGPRHIWWNFVSSSKRRIDQAADDWQGGRFPRIPGDDQEFIPLPER